MFLLFSFAYILNILGAVLNVVTWFTLLDLDLILYLCGPFLSILMSLFFGFPLLAHVEVIVGSTCISKPRANPW